MSPKPSMVSAICSPQGASSSSPADGRRSFSMRLPNAPSAVASFSARSAVLSQRMPTEPMRGEERDGRLGLKVFPVAPPKVADTFAPLWRDAHRSA